MRKGRLLLTSQMVAFNNYPPYLDEISSYAPGNGLPCGMGEEMPTPRTPAEAPQFHSSPRDRVLAVIFLVVNAPVLLLVALVIKYSFRGPILVRRASEDNHGLQVAVWEFCTSPIDLNNRNAALSAIIRNTHLSTMPRLFNIAYGELPFSALFSDGFQPAKQRTEQNAVTWDLRSHMRLTWLSLIKSTRLSEDGAAWAKAARPHILEQVLPLWAVLEHLGYSYDKVAEIECQANLSKMKDRCATCRNVAPCRRWLDGQEPANAYMDFCPNASAFMSLPGSLVLQ